MDTVITIETKKISESDKQKIEGKIQTVSMLGTLFIAVSLYFSCKEVQKMADEI